MDPDLRPDVDTTMALVAELLGIVHERVIPKKLPKVDRSFQYFSLDLKNLAHS